MVGCRAADTRLVAPPHLQPLPRPLLFRCAQGYAEPGTAEHKVGGGEVASTTCTAAAAFGGQVPLPLSNTACCRSVQAAGGKHLEASTVGRLWEWTAH